MKHKVIIYENHTHTIATANVPADSSASNILDAIIERDYPEIKFRYESDAWGVHATCKRDHLRIFAPYDERNVRILEEVMAK